MGIFVCDYAGQNNGVRSFLIAVAVAIIVIAVIHLFIEVAQLLMLKFNYLTDWTNYVDITLFIFSIMFVSSFSNCSCPSTWQWQLGSVAVFLAWINLLLYLRMLSGGNHYINRYRKYHQKQCALIILSNCMSNMFLCSFSILFLFQDCKL